MHSHHTTYRLCCQEGTNQWINGHFRWNYYMKGWVWPQPNQFPFYTWSFCPFCGSELPPFEPTMPYDPTKNGE